MLIAVVMSTTVMSDTGEFPSNLGRKLTVVTLSTAVTETREFSGGHSLFNDDNVKFSSNLTRTLTVVVLSMAMTDTEKFRLKSWAINQLPWICPRR